MHEALLQQRANEIPFANADGTAPANANAGFYFSNTKNSNGVSNNDVYNNIFSVSLPSCS